MNPMIKKLLINLILVLVGVPILLVVFLKFLNPPIWGWKVARTLFPPEGYPTQTLQTWVPLAQINPNMPLAVIASEDQNFLNHVGVDFGALFSVLAESGSPSRGASTITQQTAKNVFLFPSQTYIRKAYELYIALLLELIWGKERIMEVYLNVIEFGPGIYGVEAASQYYFGISANGLSKVQAAQLAVVLPNPYRIKPTPMSDYVNKRTHWVVSQMNNLGVISL
ncbi:monofunctional biosynthetic peptidoglycan transglycosylase [Vibrio barjaei]|jgi:monofunctional biosynthetic peptidoglycan transglycosylase|uniref:Biosynthetic peptidoglycan transglycosylase n=1 Tax=Vibrio barjaei TaxID=1676683 RepID=A0ABW7IPM2_9VIBR|nr:monofunctional biosynthetic peptidoglycan transglycosylase [Vibrio barjaei]MCY9873034.1 monofunctional biosynthetic peptidoglycan transglycosylase [Vibrio barjaei]OIN24280.1 monofunctional biosynthetic peptidoglycan transglycosylase [Vibrio barjaei]